MKPVLRVAGLTPLTGIDFPGRLAAVVFLQGCPWRCGYCQNPALIAADAPTQMTWEDVLDFLQRRHGLLDGVVFSGGEPTLQAGVEAALGQVRDLGFETGLHSAGMYPDRLARLLPLLDWVGLDIKAPVDDYEALTGMPGSAAKVRASLDHLLRSGVAYECRTTWHAGLFRLPKLHALADELAALGVTDWSLQSCRVDGRPQASPPSAELARLGRRFRRFVLR